MPWRRMGEWMYRPTLTWGEWSGGQLHTPSASPLEKEPPTPPPGTRWIGGWVDPIAVLDNVEKRKFLTLLGLELHSVVQPVASHNINCTPVRRVNTKRKHSNIEYSRYIGWNRCITCWHENRCSHRVNKHCCQYSSHWILHLFFFIFILWYGHSSLFWCCILHLFQCPFGVYGTISVGILLAVIPAKWFIQFCVYLFYFVHTVFSVLS
jgi:hypothetical protein